MAQLELKSNFDTFKADFKKDTGKDANTNIDLYIQYYNGRINDYNMQISLKSLSQMTNDINQLPSMIRLRIGEMINEMRKDGKL